MITQQTSTIALTDYCCDMMNRREVTEEQKNTFISILQETQSRLKKEDPREILKEMTAAEMEVLRKVHSLADPIKVSELDKEGALNLLLQPGSARDINNDGFIRNGKAWTWTFPPPNAPQEVKDAWEEQTAGMTEMERMLSISPFMVAEMEANLKYDSRGNVVGFYGPWDKEYVNIYRQPGFSYQNLVKGCLEHLEIAKSYYSLEQYTKRKEFLEGFMDMLIKHDAK